jgi:hypothetical protein
VTSEPHGGTLIDRTTDRPEDADELPRLYLSGDEYTDLESGDRGTVIDVTTTTVPSKTSRGHVERNKIWVEWDDGGSLAMIGGEDRIRRVDDAE